MKIGLGIGVVGRTGGVSASFSVSIGSGDVTSGTELTATVSGLAGGETVTYQWTDDGANITGATASTYSPTIGTDSVADASLIRCIATVDGTPYTSGARRVIYAAGSFGALTNQSFTNDTGNQTYVFAAATGTGLTWTYSLVSPPSGVTINSGTRTIAFDTDALAVQSGTVITVRALDQYDRNPGDQTFTLAITEAASGGVVVAQQVAGFSAPLVAASEETLPITIGSGSNRALVAVIPINGGPNGQDLSSITATFGTDGRAAGTGTSMTIFGPYNVGGRRPQIAFAVLVNPSTGAGTVQVDGMDITTAMTCRLYELTGADQTIGNYAAFATGAAGGTSATTSGTVAAGALISALCLMSGDYSSEISVTGLTLDDTDNTGTSSFSDLTAGYVHETGVSAGTDGHAFTWTTSADNQAATLSIPAA